MQRVTFTNGLGETIELYHEPFFLNKIEGLGEVEAEIKSHRSINQDGSTPTTVTLMERYIPMEVVITRDLLINRKTISRVFNPKFGQGVLVYENDDTRLEILAMSEHVPSFPDERPRVGQKVVIDLICHDPYWTSEAIVDEMTVWEGGLEFPLELPTEFAVMSDTKTKLIYNGGDVDSAPLIVFNGPATAPIRVKNLTTNKFIEINQNLAYGESLEINTKFGQKSVTKIDVDGNRTSAFHLITLGSSFFNIIPGNNLLDYSTGEDYERAAVTLMWRMRYAGV